MDFLALNPPPRIQARWAVAIRGSVEPPRAEAVDRHLILVHLPGWQSAADFEEIAGHVRVIEPGIGTFLLRGDLPHSYTRRHAARRPTLVFSPGPLQALRPLRGRLYQGRPIPKIEQLRRLAAVGVPIPRTAVLTPDLRLDPAMWSDFVIVKPTDLASSSSGAGIQLMRTGRVRYRPPEDYPPGHPGRLAPMLVQQFIHTGERIGHYRALTLFGETISLYHGRAARERLDLSASDEVIERAVVATQAVEKDKSFVDDPDVIAIARAAHAAMPDVPLKGCDILRDARTGALYVIEVNPGGNTWHFSSSYLATARRANGPEFERRRREQFDAMRTAARLLVARTLAEAE